MANTVIALKKSATPSSVPSDLANGELAINYADGKLYYKSANGTIASISGNEPNYFGTVNANNTLIVSDTPGDILTIVAGDNINIVGDAINDRITIGADISSAFNQANSKTYTFYQNTAPSTANAEDLWVNSDTGFVYQNFGNTSLPVWAEFGPTALIANTTPGTVIGSTANLNLINVVYQPATTVGAGITVLGANTQGGAGYNDFLKVTNISAGANNTNKTFRLNSTGGLEVINSAYTAALLVLTDSGNLSASGTITAGNYTPGQVIKDTMLSNSEMNVISTSIATSGSNQNFITYNYTPVSSSSYLVVHIHISRYDPQGTTDDSWYSVLAVDGTEIAYGWQMVNDNGTGTSGRSGVLFPLTGRYTNSSTSTKQIQVAARRDAADDNINITNSSTGIWLRITEIAR